MIGIKRLAQGRDAGIDILLCGICFFFTYRCVGWMLAPDYFFRADDWFFLHCGQFLPYAKFFAIFPDSLYNNRPVGTVFNMGLYSIFGLNHVAFHATFFGIHLLNIVLVYTIARRIFNGGRVPAFIAALLFAATNSALKAVIWVAAVYDVLGHTFVLLAILFYLRRGRWAIPASLLFFYLALRTKEFGLLIPGFLVLYELLLDGPGFSRRKIRAAFTKTRWHWLIFALLAVIYIILACGHRFIGAADYPYHLSVNFGEFWSGMRFYLSELLITYAPQCKRYSGALAVLFFVLFAWGAIRRNRPLVFSGICFVASLLPVLFLKNHRQALYLYNPLFFFTIFIAGLIDEPRQGLRRMRRTRRVFDGVVLALLCAACFYSTRDSHFINVRNYFVRWGRFCYNNYTSLKTHYPTVKPQTKFFIAGLPKYHNVFDYKRGHMLAVFYKDDLTGCMLYQSDGDLLMKYQRYPYAKVLLRHTKDGFLEPVSEKDFLSSMSKPKTKSRL